MYRTRSLLAHCVLSLFLLGALTGAVDVDDDNGADDAKDTQDENEGAFKEFEDNEEKGTAEEKFDPDTAGGEFQDSVPKDGGDVADTTGTTTTVSRLQRHELPEDGFIWPTTDAENFEDTLDTIHRCNGCKAVAHQLNLALTELMPKDGKRVLAEHEYTEAMECKVKTYDDYGLKKLEDNTRVIVGPGLPHSGQDEGSTFGGGKWPTRIARYCGQLIGDTGDEPEVYRMWVDHGSDGFSDMLCSPSCGGGKRIKKKDPEEEEEEKPKKKRRKAAKKEEASLDGPPQVTKIYDKKEITKLVKKKKIKFVFLLFCAPSFKGCVKLQTQFELAARAAKKNDEMKEVKFAWADTDSVGTFDFTLDKDVLPAFLLFRKGYAAPKGMSPEEMLQMKEVGDFLNYIQNELGEYMQDDPENFPRGKLEL